MRNSGNNIRMQHFNKISPQHTETHALFSLRTGLRGSVRPRSGHIHPKQRKAEVAAIYNGKNTPRNNCCIFHRSCHCHPIREKLHFKHSKNQSGKFHPDPRPKYFFYFSKWYNCKSIGTICSNNFDTLYTPLFTLHMQRVSGMLATLNFSGLPEWF